MKTYAATAKGKSYTMTVSEAATPNGKSGVRITCSCPTHPAGKSAAIIASPFGESFDRKLIHGNVTMAHSPAGALMARQGRLWAA